MCLMAFALAPGTSRPFVLAANRDEFWHRPTQGLGDWQLPHGARVYAGRDLEAGGTWIGFSDRGRVALVTNVRQWPPEAAPRSRGELACSWLDSDLSWADWLAQYPAGDYGGVNLVLGQCGPTTPGGWVWLTNHQPAAAEPAPACGQGWWGHTLQPGLYGLSNAAMDTPWPKTVALKKALDHALRSGADVAASLHLSLLDARAAPDAALPHTGAPPDLERRLSSTFVHDPLRGYGTRSSLVAMADGAGLTLHEWTHQVRDHHPQNGFWPAEASAYKRLSISMWGMPTSS